MRRALNGRPREERHWQRDEAEDDEAVEQVVLDGVPPGPEALGALGVTLDLLAHLAGQRRHPGLATGRSRTPQKYPFLNQRR